VKETAGNIIWRLALEKRVKKREGFGTDESPWGKRMPVEIEAGQKIKVIQMFLRD
jgi:hypothetical protein